MERVIIHKADYVWDGVNDKVLPSGAVLVEGGRIRAVGPASEICTASHASVFEWPGATLLPGLIDSHTHLSMDGSLENYLDHMADSVAVLTLRATAMMERDLMAGVTTCRCLGDREFLDVACRETVEKGEVLGPGLLVATRGIRAPEGHGFVGYPFKGKEEIKQAIRENIARGANLIKIYITGTLKGTGSLPAYLTREEIKLAIEESHNAGIPVAAHCVGGQGFDWAIELGLDTIEHAYQITREQAARLARSKTSLVLTPGAVLAEERVNRLPKHLIQGHVLEREQMFASMALAVDAQISFGVGTDGTHGDLARDIQYLSELGTPNWKALKAATSDGAKVCRIEHDTGSLEKGKYADIIAVEGNPLKDLNALRKVIAIIRRGKLIKPHHLAPLILVLLILMGCGPTSTTDHARTSIKISVVNAPADIVTMGAQFLATELLEKSGGRLDPKVYHSGVLSGGKGEAEIEMCQQGSIEIHVTSTAYLASLVPKTSVVSLPFLFRDIDQVVALVKSKSPVLDSINLELNEKDLHIIAWWPRGFRQLTNSSHPVRSVQDVRGLKLRVMNNPLYADNIKAMLANPVPMAWGEVYNGLQLKTIDGQENAEDVIYSSKLFEAQQYMTIWDYSVDLEVVLVNLAWWKQLSVADRKLIQDVADASVDFEEKLLRSNTLELRKKIAAEGMEIYYVTSEHKTAFREAVTPVWKKYEEIFGKSFLDSFLVELKKY